MRITVDLDEKTLKGIKSHTKMSKTSPAISFVVLDWLKQQERNAFLDNNINNPPGYSMTNEELERKLYGID